MRKETALLLTYKLNQVEYRYGLWTLANWQVFSLKMYNVGKK